MQSRTVLPVVGQRIRVRESPPYDLPKSLTPGQIVTVQKDVENAGLLVADEHGAAFRIAVQNAALRSEYFTGGQWLPETHPEVVQWFREQLAEHEATRDRWPSGVERQKEWFIAKARQVIARAEKPPPSS